MLTYVFSYEIDSLILEITYKSRVIIIAVILLAGRLHHAWVSGKMEHHGTPFFKKRIFIKIVTLSTVNIN